MNYSEIRYHHARRGYIEQHARDIAQRAFPRSIGVNLQNIRIILYKRVAPFEQLLHAEMNQLLCGFPNVRRLLMAMLIPSRRSPH